MHGVLTLTLAFSFSLNGLAQDQSNEMDAAATEYVAATDDAVAGDATEAVPAEEGINWDKVVDTLIGLFISLLYLAIIGHMVYELFIRKSVYKKDGYSLEEMKAARSASGKGELSVGEIETLNQLMESAVADWTSATDNKLYPTKISHIRNAEKAIARMAELLPTDQAYVDRMNEIVESLNISNKRVFNGSIKLIVLTVIVAALLSWMAKSWAMIPFFLISLAIYWGASMTPTWMLQKKALFGKKNRDVSGGVIAGILAFVGSAQTVRTITTYTDGSRDVSDDHSQHWVFLMIGIILLVFLAMFMAVWAIFNYVRNYLLYL